MKKKAAPSVANKNVQAFSQQLDDWLHSRHPKTLDGLIKASGEKSFAIVFLVLMAIPALPLPTGGVTHIFEVITMLLALELIAGRRDIWLPKKWLHRPLGKTLEKHTLPYLIRKIRWLEKYSRPRLGSLLTSHTYLRVVGLVVLALALASFLSPPFSGLDTLPALGVVIISLSVMLEDIVVFAVGLAVGLTGVALDIVLGAALTASFHHFLF